MTTDTVSNTLLTKINEITKSINTCESESANTNNLNKLHIVEQLTRAYVTLNLIHEFCDSQKNINV